jgi:hypothetical protein
MSEILYKSTQSMSEQNLYWMRIFTKTMTLKEISVYLPDEMWIQIYSYVGEHPIASILRVGRFDLLEIHRCTIANMGNPQLSNRKLVNLHYFSYINLECCGINGIESNIRDYIPHFKYNNDNNNNFINGRMKYFNEYNEASDHSMDFQKMLKKKYCSEKVICICGSSIMRKGLRKHLLSNKHKDFIA